MRHQVETKKKKPAIRIAVVLMGVALAPSLAFAGSTTNKGASPNGKPFVEIQGQFVEVNEEILDMQAHLDSVVERVDGLEERVSANETAIAGLEAKNDIVDQQIQDLLAATAANNELVTSALATIASLEGDLDLLRGDVVLNAEAIAATEEEIAIQRDFVTANTAGLQTLEHRLAKNLKTIAALKRQISVIQKDLRTKQDVLDGNCPAGTALTAIDPTGAITCKTAGTGFTKFTVKRYVQIPGYQRQWVAGYCHYHGWSWYCHSGYYTTVYSTGTATATCPAGSILTGGGHLNPHYNTSILSSSSTATVNHPANSWIVNARNLNYYPVTVYAKAECMSFN